VFAFGACDNFVLSPRRWARRGDVWEAADLMQQMKREGVQPDIHTYTSFVNACCKAGDMQVCIIIHYCLFPIKLSEKSSY
jgi:pentatricopeptide repeat protein